MTLELDQVRTKKEGLFIQIALKHKVVVSSIFLIMQF